MDTQQVSMIGNLKAPTMAIFEWFKKPSNLFNSVGVPLLSITIFLILWGLIAAQIDTSLGKVPGPVKVWEQAVILYQEHVDERHKEAAFYARQEKRNAEKLLEDPQAEVKIRPYTGKPTFLDQIVTSILTVATGFFIASLIAIPIGIICGLSTTLYTALNPIIQTFKPISPLAWLPIVTIIVSAVYISDDRLLLS